MTKRSLMTITYSIVSFYEKLLSEILLIVISVCLFITGLIVYENHVMVTTGYQKNFREYSPSRSFRFPELNGAIAWIRIDNTPIDYVVMQADNNSKYLNRQPDGSFALSGSIFLDYRNQSDFSDDYCLIYGHHMASQAMFGSLDRYYKESYFKKHRHGTLTLCDGTVFQMTAFSILKGRADNPIYYELPGISMTQRLNIIKRESHTYFAPDNHHILALSTCASQSSLDRTIVFMTLSRS
ncbi:MAG: class B sortase [Erysipelotrichaceae bacterium]|nr:class B sortase [Erysipelotrichaceae bacterium]